VIRTPLRPLARILLARQKGENPDAIERENLRQRHEVQRKVAHARADFRLKVTAGAFLICFSGVAVQMAVLAATQPVEPTASAPGAEILAQRADIVDRQGRILATNMTTHALYAHPRDMVDPARVARELAAIFPDLEAEALTRRFTDGRSFVWIRRVLSPEQMQKVHEIGDPGLLFGPREMRLYPNGMLAAHVLGGASFGAEGVHSAEVIGTAGIEKALDARLRDPAQAGTPLRLTLDLTLQAAVEEVLGAGKLWRRGGAFGRGDRHRRDREGAGRPAARPRPGGHAPAPHARPHAAGGGGGGAGRGHDHAQRQGRRRDPDGGAHGRDPRARLAARF
jgi:cell division protein FtsI (penicillin-binding protein 3)